jgi:hypothetical protein
MRGERRGKGARGKKEVEEAAQEISKRKGRGEGIEAEDCEKSVLNEQ